MKTSRPMVLGLLFLLLPLATTSIARSDVQWQDGIPIFGKDATPAEKKEAISISNTRLKAFKSRTFLSESMSAIYGSSVQSLIGRYCYVDKGSKLLTCIGANAYSPKETKVELKDEIVFKAVVDQKFTFGLKLAFLDVKLGSHQIGELNIQDTVTVVSKPDANEITCRFPLAIPAEAKGLQMLFIDGATVTTISTRQFSKGEAGGDAAFAMIKVGGTTYTSTEVVERRRAVSISATLATPLDPKDETYTDKKAACVALLKGKKGEQTVVSSIATDATFSAFAPPPPEPLGGEVLDIAVKECSEIKCD